MNPIPLSSFDKISAGAEISSLGNGIYDVNGYIIDVLNKPTITQREITGFEPNPDNPSQMQAIYTTNSVENPAYRGDVFYTNCHLAVGSFLLSLVVGLQIFR